MYQFCPGAPATFLHFELTVNTSRIEYIESRAGVAAGIIEPENNISATPTRGRP